MKRICLAAAAAVVGLCSSPVWAESPGADYYLRQDRVFVAPMIPTVDPNTTGDPNPTTGPTSTPTPTPSSTSTPRPEETCPPDLDGELADTGSMGWGALGLGLGVIVAGVGVLILVRRK